MTNRMPLVGQRYTVKEDFYFVKAGEEIEISKVDNEKIYFKARAGVFDAYRDLFFNSCKEAAKN